MTKIINEAKENNEGRFLCLFCARTLSTKGNLRVHLESQHSIDRHPRICHVCGSRARNKDALRHHMRRYHNNSKHSALSDDLYLNDSLE